VAYPTALATALVAAFGFLALLATGRTLRPRLILGLVAGLGVAGAVAVVFILVAVGHLRL
jgi:predicted RND superfamily exporter protein